MIQNPRPEPPAESDIRLGWRMEAMRKRVPPTGPIPVMYARLGPVAAGGCLSCGESLTPGSNYCCALCVEASERVLKEVRG